MMTKLKQSSGTPDLRHLLLEYQKQVANGPKRLRLEAKASNQIRKTSNIFVKRVMSELRIGGFVPTMEAISQQQREVNPLTGNIPLNKDLQLRLIQTVWQESMPFKPSSVELRKSLEAVHADAFKMGIESFLIELGLTHRISKAEVIDDEPINFVLTASAVLLLLETRARQVEEIITDTIVKDLQFKFKAQIFENNESVNNVINEAERDGVPRWKSDQISVSEVQAGLSIGRHEIATRSGVAEHKWVSVGDNKVRPTHIKNESEGWIPINQRFSNGALHVGDGIDQINCRCSEQFNLTTPDLLLDIWEGD